jgi:hypothetical protein
MLCICICTAATPTTWSYNPEDSTWLPYLQGRADHLMNIERIKVERPPLEVFNKLLSPMHFMKPLILLLPEWISSVEVKGFVVEPTRSAKNSSS